MWELENKQFIGFRHSFVPVLAKQDLLCGQLEWTQPLGSWKIKTEGNGQLFIFQKESLGTPNHSFWPHFYYVHCTPHGWDLESVYIFFSLFSLFFFFLTFSINHIRMMKLSCVHQKASNVNENNVTLWLWLPKSQATCHWCPSCTFVLCLLWAKHSFEHLEIGGLVTDSQALILLGKDPGMGLWSSLTSNTSVL